MSIKWDRRFLSIAKNVSLWSRDPSTKCGAVITRGKFVVALGFNGFPTGVSDANDLYADREKKYKRVLHAELNAILSAKQDLTGCTVYVYPLPPCSQCAAAIIQTGITRVVTLNPTKDLEERWGASLKEATDMFAEAKVDFQKLILNI